MSPVIKELARQYTGVLFLIIDTDVHSWYRRHRSLQSDGIPYFVFFSDGRKVADVSGADPDAVAAQVARLDRAPPLASTPRNAPSDSLLQPADFEGQVFELQGLKSRADLNGTACIGYEVSIDQRIAQHRVLNARSGACIGPTEGQCRCLLLPLLHVLLYCFGLTHC